MGKGFGDPLQLAGEPEVLKDDGTCSRSVDLGGLAGLPPGCSKVSWRGVVRIEPKVGQSKGWRLDWNAWREFVLNSVSLNILLKISRG